MTAPNKVIGAITKAAITIATTGSPKRMSKSSDITANMIRPVATLRTHSGVLDSFSSGSAVSVVESVEFDLE